MKYTLLELTQAVLSSMDSDEVTSINDTVESQQVVEVIKAVYDDIISRGDLQTNKTLFNLTASGDNTKPILMSKPANIDRVEWIKYNIIALGETTPNWIYVKYLPPDAFVNMMQRLNTTDTTVGTFTHTFPAGYSIVFQYWNNTHPAYYTTFDDGTLFFDAYNNTVDTTLTAAKTVCYGTTASDFQKLDSYTPNLQPQQFALLLNESKSLAWAELKQSVHAKAEQMAKRNWVHLQHTRNEVPDQNKFSGGTHNFSKLPNFSRIR